MIASVAGLGAGASLSAAAPRVLFFACEDNSKHCDIGTVDPAKPADVKIDVKGAGGLKDNAIASSPNGKWVIYWEGPGLNGNWPKETFGGNILGKILWGEVGKGLAGWTGLGKNCESSGNVLSYRPTLAPDGSKGIVACAYGDGMFLSSYKFGSDVKTQPTPVLFKGKKDSKAAQAFTWAIAPDATKAVYAGPKGMFLDTLGNNKPAPLTGALHCADSRMLFTGTHVIYKIAKAAHKYQLVVHDIAAKKSAVAFDFQETMVNHREGAPDAGMAWDKAGNAVYFLDVRQGERGDMSPLYRLDLKTNKATKVMDGVHDIYGVSGDGKSFAYSAPKNPGKKPDAIGSIDFGTAANPGLLGVFDMQTQKGTTFALPKELVTPIYAGIVN